MSMWTLARRTARMNPSILREILKVAERPGVLSMAGGLPSPDTFPVEAHARRLRHRCCATQPREALQYAAERRLPAAAGVGRRAPGAGRADASRRTQVLITTGSQQGLDLVGKVLIDAGAPVAVEAPTYLGALQAFVPVRAGLRQPGRATTTGPLPESIARLPRRAPGTRFAYLLPNFQNPTGRQIPRRRAATRWSPRRSPPACRSSRTTPTAISGSTRRRRRR